MRFLGLPRDEFDAHVIFQQAGIVQTARDCGQPLTMGRKGNHPMWRCYHFSCRSPGGGPEGQLVGEKQIPNAGNRLVHLPMVPGHRILRPGESRVRLVPPHMREVCG